MLRSQRAGCFVVKGQLHKSKSTKSWSKPPNTGNSHETNGRFLKVFEHVMWNKRAAKDIEKKTRVISPLQIGKGRNCYFALVSLTVMQPSFQWVCWRRSSSKHECKIEKTHAIQYWETPYHSMDILVRLSLFEGIVIYIHIITYIYKDIHIYIYIILQGTVWAVKLPRKGEVQEFDKVAWVMAGCYKKTSAHPPHAALCMHILGRYKMEAYKNRISLATIWLSRGLVSQDKPLKT